MNQEFSLKQNGKILVLQRNGVDTQCPFRAAVPVYTQDRLGQTKQGFYHDSCSTLCPLLDLTHLNDGGTNVTLRCRGKYAPVIAACEIEKDNSIVN